MKPGNGSIKYRNRRIYINWRGENAQHIAENYINSPRLHPFLHLQIQKYLQKAEIRKRRKTVFGVIKTDFGILFIPLIIVGTLAHIKTAYIIGEEDKRINGIKKISGSGHSQYEKWRLRISEDAIDRTFNEMGEEEAPDLLDGFLDYLIEKGLTLNVND